MKELRILLIGGGSGGHVYPLIAVAESLRQKASALNLDLKLMILGDGDFIKRAAQENNIPFKLIRAGKLRRYASAKNLIDLINIPISFVQSFWYLFWFMPDGVFSKGGYDSVPPAIVARLFLIPVFIHESDSVPGLANSIVGRFSKKIFLSFKNAEKNFNKSKTVFTGNPTRKKIFQGDKNSAREYFNLREQRPTILILGGSQGAKPINDVIVSSVVAMSKKYNIIHQCGDGQYEFVKKDIDTIMREGTREYSAPVGVYYRPYPFLNEKELTLAYALADIIVSRAGAGSLFEIAQAGKPAIIIPIQQSASNHQYFNAFEFSLSGGYLMEESNLNRESLIREIDILLDQEHYSKVSERIKLFAAPGAADMIAEEIISGL